MQLTLLFLFVAGCLCGTPTYTVTCGTTSCDTSANYFVAGGPASTPLAATADPSMYVARGALTNIDFQAGAAHPFALGQLSMTLPNPVYTAGVTNTPASTAVIVGVTLNSNAPDNLYYQCQNHMDMSGKVQVGDAVIDGGQQTTPVTTPGVGVVSCFVDTVSNKLWYNVRYEGFQASAGHFHGPADAATDGGVMVTLDSVLNAGVNNVGPSVGVNVTAAEATALTTGMAYVNLHSVANAGGEIRGQVDCVAVSEQTADFITDTTVSSLEPLWNRAIAWDPGVVVTVNAPVLFIGPTAKLSILGASFEQIVVSGAVRIDAGAVLDIQQPAPYTATIMSATSISGKFIITTLAGQTATATYTSTGLSVVLAAGGSAPTNAPAPTPAPTAGASSLMVPFLLMALVAMFLA